MIDITDSGGRGLSRRRLLGRTSALAGSVAAASLLAACAPAGTAAEPAAPAPAGVDPAARAYLGYRRADYAKPYAKYFTETTAAPQSQVLDALARPSAAQQDIPPVADLGTEITTPGYSKIETGWGATGEGPTGVTWAAALTRMPGVTPEMWDWWFGWHSLEPARYKLWHPEAHLHASLTNPIADEPGLSDKDKYIGNTSYADEYLPDFYGSRAYLGDGAGLIQVGPGITFVDPASIGIDLSTFDGTAVVGRGGKQGTADTTTLFVHQVRRVEGGSEMRSRFYVNGSPTAGVRAADPAAEANEKARLPLSAPVNVGGFFNMLHAGQEMNHLAGFLPDLYREFSTSR